MSSSSQFRAIINGPKINSKGRKEWCHDFNGPAKCFRVLLDDNGYDDGGAYWGIDALKLYCLTNGKGFRLFIRAMCRADAIAKLETAFPFARIQWVRILPDSNNPPTKRQP